MSSESSPEPAPAGRRRQRRAGWWLVAVAGVAGILIGLAYLAVLERQLAAPDRLRSLIETRLESRLNGLDVRLNHLSVVFEAGWRPRVRLRDIALVDLETGAALRLSHVDTQLSFPALLRGQIVPRALRVSGLFLVLRRSADGQVSIQLGELDNVAGGSRDIGAVMPALRQVLSGPDLGQLSRFAVDAITLRYDDLRAERSWTVDGGRFEARRTGEDLSARADFALLGGGADAAVVALNLTGRLDTGRAELGASFEDVPSGDIATQSPAMAWLGILRAPISGALRAEISPDGGLGPLNATLRIGKGVLQPRDTVRPVPFDAARGYFTYDPGTMSIRFDELAVESGWVTARAEGRAVLADMERGLPRSLMAQVRLSGISANPAGLYGAPVAFETAQADIRLRLDPFDLSLGQLTIETGGATTRASGRLLATETGWDLSLDAHRDAIDKPRLMALWPERAIPRTRSWVADNLEEATIENIDLALRARPGARPDLYLAFGFRDAEIRFLKGMPPLRGAAGHAELIANRFSVVAEAGTVTADTGGALDATGTAFIIENTANRGGAAQVRVAARGPVQALLSLLNRPPLSFLDQAGQPVDVAEGRVRVGGTIGLMLRPKVPPEDLVFDLTGRATSVRSDRLIPGRVLQAEALDVSLRGRALKVGGAAMLDGIPIDATWTLPLPRFGVPEGATGDVADPGLAPGTSRVRGTVALGPQAVDVFGIGLPPGSVSGLGSGVFQLEFARGVAPRLALSSDLRGIGLALDMLGWRKPAATAGRLDVRGFLGSPARIDRLDLSAAGLEAEGAVTLRPDGSLERLRLERLRVGDWLDAPVDLLGRGAGQPPQIVTRGGRLSVAGLPVGGEGAGGAGTGAPLTVALDRLAITDTIALTGFTGEFSTGGALAGAFRGRINGGAAVRGRAEPVDAGGSRYIITGGDAGAALRDVGVLKNATGGDLTLSLTPTGRPGTFAGALRVRNTRLRDAPAMAELLNAISVVGLLEQLGGEGISFAEVDADFEIRPDMLVLARSSAVGPSLGVSMDGFYDFATGTLDMQGVVSPIYMLNMVGRVIARQGEGLIGFTFRLRGNAEQPRVSVNPLSALTPGLFREIFRRPAPVLDSVPAPPHLPTETPEPANR